MEEIVTLKLLIVGNCGTGKTSFAKRWHSDVFPENVTTTTVTDISSKEIEHKNKKYKIHLWDIGGQDRNIEVINIIAKDVLGIILVSEVNKDKSLNDTLKWKKAINEKRKFPDGEELPMILVQNKIDLLENKDDIDEKVKLREFIEKNNILMFFNCSAKLDINVKEAMDFLIKNVIGRLEEYNSKKDKEGFKNDGNINNKGMNCAEDEDKKSIKLKKTPEETNKGENNSLCPC